MNIFIKKQANFQNNIQEEKVPYESAEGYVTGNSHGAPKRRFLKYPKASLRLMNNTSRMVMSANNS